MLCRSVHICVYNGSKLLEATMYTANNASVLIGPQQALEVRIIEEYLLRKGYHLRELKMLPNLEARRLMAEACAFASLKLAEIESRAKFIKKI